MKIRYEEAETAVKLATTIIEAFQEQDVEIEVAFAAFGNGFFRIAKAMGLNKKEFAHVCETLAESYNKDQDGQKNT